MLHFVSFDRGRNRTKSDQNNALRAFLATTSPHRSRVLSASKTRMALGHPNLYKYYEYYGAKWHAFAAMCGPLW